MSTGTVRVSAAARLVACLFSTILVALNSQLNGHSMAKLLYSTFDLFVACASTKLQPACLPAKSCARWL